jgi:hypothetical protein
MRNYWGKGGIDPYEEYTLIFSESEKEKRARIGAGLLIYRRMGTQLKYITSSQKGFF